MAHTVSPFYPQRQPEPASGMVVVVLVLLGCRFSHIRVRIYSYVQFSVCRWASPLLCVCCVRLSAISVYIYTKLF